MADSSARDRAIAHAQEDIVSGDPGDEAMPPQIAAWVIDGLLARPGVLEALAADCGAGTATPADPRAMTDEQLALLERYATEGNSFRPDDVPLTFSDMHEEIVRLRSALASRTPGEPRPSVDEMEAHFLDANERMGEALVAIGMALGLPRPRTGATWGAPEILAKIAAGAPGEPSLGLAVESSPLCQEALRIIRESWAALPAAVRDEAAKDGATLAGCIRAIPLAAPPLRGDGAAGEFDWFRTGQASTSGGDR